ncbi:MAG: T9SS type A sorting domain-containing protein [Bacteroidia bacterium]|jgi:hypothetical protein|nr:T9SS type A sorting domain-containing protein [Bacteroidia bacterium]
MILAPFYGMGQVITYNDFGNLGDGLKGGGAVRALFYDTIGHKLYAGGAFTFGDNKPVWGAAVWDGIKWDSLQGGFTQYPHVTPLPNQASDFAWKIIRYQNKIFFSGGLVWINGKNQYHMGIWDLATSKWVYPIAEPPNGDIFDFAVYNNELYACGQFTKFGNTTCNYIAKYNGINWQPVGNFSLFCKGYPPAQITSITSFQGELILGGLFRDSTGEVRNIARYNGINWQSLGTGIRQGGVNSVQCLKVFDNELYIGGYFSKTSEIPGRNLVKWDGTNYKSVGPDAITNGAVWDIQKNNNRMVVLGNFLYHGSNSAQGFLYIDGDMHCTVSGLDSVLNLQGPFFEKCAFINDSLVVAGRFTFFNGTDTVNDVAVMKNYEQYSSCLITGVEETGFHSSKVRIYPNPFEDNITIEVIDESSDDLVGVEILSLVGQVLISKEKIQANETINLSVLSAGIYLLKIKSESEETTLKIVKSN